MHEGEITLRYNGRNGRVIYKVQIKPSNDLTWTDNTYTGKKSVVISGLVRGELYDIRVATISAAGIGGWSNIVSQKAMYDQFTVYGKTTVNNCKLVNGKLKKVPVQVVRVLFYFLSVNGMELWAELKFVFIQQRRW